MTHVTTSTENRVARIPQRHDPVMNRSALLLLLYSGYGDIGSILVYGPLADTLDEGQVIDAAERTVLLAVLDDGLCF